MTDEPSQPRFMTLRQVADLLRCSEKQTYSLIRSGDLQGIQIGGRNQWRVEHSKLEEYIEGRLGAPPRTWRRLTVTTPTTIRARTIRPRTIRPRTTTGPVERGLRPRLLDSA